MAMDDLRALEYAVFDVETTGLHPSHHHKIVEISIQRINGYGELLREYTTVINPNRDPGPQHIHRLSAKQLSNAPDFGAIAGDILACISGAILVAHNIAFDRAFLNASFDEMGIELPSYEEICTMRFGSQLFPEFTTRKLSSFCEQLSIPLIGAHAAEEDAKATCKLLTACFDRFDQCAGDINDYSGVKIVSRDTQSWPVLPISGQRVTRDMKPQADSDFGTRIGSFVDRLPVGSSGHGTIDEYLDVLSRSLEDRILSDVEISALESVAAETGLTNDDITRAHNFYVSELIRFALDDDIITDDERHDIYDVAIELGFPEDEIPLLIAGEQHASSENASLVLKPNSVSLKGLTVCLTGQLLCTYEGEQLSRSTAMKMCEEAGMVPTKSVTKKLDVLVAADPHSMSGKAKKARDYGTRIIAERELWHILDIPVG
jgi:DNA polymerase-3 subunit epsilon